MQNYFSVNNSVVIVLKEDAEWRQDEVETDDYAFFFSVKILSLDLGKDFPTYTHMCAQVIDQLCLKSGAHSFYGVGK